VDTHSSDWEPPLVTYIVPSCATSNSLGQCSLACGALTVVTASAEPDGEVSPFLNGMRRMVAAS
jgi:hypothetical protein